MNARIEDHPDFPYRAESEAKRARWVASFLDRPERGDAAYLLREFVAHVHIYAFLERLIQGDILYHLPAHRRVIQAPFAGKLEDQSEELALRELELFGFADYPAAELADRLAEMGIKVLHTRAVKEGELCGSFFFEGALGPAMLVGAEPDSAEAVFVLAHELAHLVADINPYRARYCRWHAGTLKNRIDTPEERRADRFARALLVPPTLLGDRLRELALDLRLDVLATLFGVPAILIVQRLTELGRAPVGAAKAARAMAPPRVAIEGEVPAKRAGVGEHILLPDRYVNLAAAAWAARVLEHELLARFLGVPETEARALLEWLGVAREPMADETIH